MRWGLVKAYEVGLHMADYEIIQKKYIDDKICNDLTHS